MFQSSGPSKRVSEDFTVQIRLRTNGDSTVVRDAAEVVRELQQWAFENGAVKELKTFAGTLKIHDGGEFGDLTVHSNFETMEKLAADRQDLVGQISTRRPTLPGMQRIILSKEAVAELNELLNRPASPPRSFKARDLPEGRS